MARVNVYLPDDLSDAARAADLNISHLAQEAIRRELRQTGIRDWIASVTRLAPIRLDHAAVASAIDAAREELGAAHG